MLRLSKFGITKVSLQLYIQTQNLSGALALCGTTAWRKGACQAMEQHRLQPGWGLLGLPPLKMVVIGNELSRA